MMNHHHLSEIGFEGFERLLDPGLARKLPHASGIYVALLDPPTPVQFLTRSVGGHFKDKDPTVREDVLRQKYIAGCVTQYIGRATTLDQRVPQLARFGRGEPVGHWGGRYLWQLPEHRNLRVAWRLEADPAQAEADLLDEFETTYGQLPFANLMRGRRAAAVA